MSYALPLGILALANFLGIVSPGPAFIMVTRAAAGGSRRAALGLATGVAIAVTIWAAAASFGVVVVMTRFAAIYGAVQLAGGLYLVWLGISAWRAARAGKDGPAAVPQGSGGTRGGYFRSILVGTALSLGNPKIVVFFASIFVALLPEHAPLWVRLAAVGIVFVQEICWYSGMAMVFSHRRVQALYRRANVWVERVAGTVLIAFGVRLLTLVRL